MSKYIKWIGLVAAATIAISCFLPWTFHGDINKVFTGFFSENNNYGKPGKYLLVFAILIAAGYITSRVWAKRIILFLAAINFAYALKTFLLFSSCYRGYCPEKKLGLWLMIICASIMLIAAVFPDMKIRKGEEVSREA
jgi:O-antigen ligase